MSNLLKDASILLTPTAYENGRMNAIKPYKDLYGPELVTNGDFATDSNWTKGTGWSIGNGKASRTSQSGSTSMYQSVSFTANKSYKITYDLDISAGSFLLRIGGGALIDTTPRTTSGTYTEYIVANSGNNVLNLRAVDGSFVGSVDNVSVKEDLTGDFTFSRNSAATRVNAQGLVENVQIISSELVSNGNFSQIGTEEVSNGNFSQEGSELVSNGNFSNGLTNWSVNGGSYATIVGGALNSNNTENGSWFAENVSQSVSFVQNKIYKVTFKAKNISGDLNLRITHQSHIIFSQNITSSFVDYTIYYTAQANNDSIRIFCNDAVGQFQIDNVSVKEVGQDWTISSGASVGEDKLDIDAGAFDFFATQTALTNGLNYKVTLDAEVTSGDILLYTGTQFASINSSGSYTFYTTSDSAQIRFRSGGSGFNGSITNISVKEVGQDWTFGTGWSVGDGYAVTDGTINSNVRQDNIIAVGKKYKYSFDVLNSSAGDVRGRFRSGNGAILNFFGEGTYSGYFVSTDTYINITTLSTNTASFAIDNISVKEITDDTDLPRINYEGFSYQDSLGSEEVTNGDFATDSNWTKQTGWSIDTINGKAIAQNVPNLQRLQQNISGFTPVVGATYQYSFDISNVDGFYTIWAFGNTILNSVNTEGTITGTFEATSTNNGFYFAGATAGGLVSATLDNVSVKEYLGQEVVPDSGCGSWLLEPQSTNLIPYSSDFSSLNLRSNAAVTSNEVVSPSGDLDADKITFDGTLHGRVEASIPATVGQPYTISLYLKNKDLSDVTQVWIGFSAASQGQFVTITNEWQRYDITTNADGTTEYPRIQFSGTGSLYAWGFQTEQQSYATSYIPTNGATNTRLQDIATNSGNSTLINSTEGVLYAEIDALAIYNLQRWLGISDGTNNNKVIIALYNSATNYVIACEVKSGGSTQAFMTYNFGAVEPTFTKVAFKYKENDFALWVNGTEVKTDTSGSAPIGLSELAFDRGDGAQKFEGKAKALAVYKEALTDANLRCLTYPNPVATTFDLDFDTIAEQFTFTRGSEATFVNAQGLIESTNELGAELVTNGDFSNGSTGWSLSGSNISIVNGKGISTGSNFGAQFKQTILQTNKTYKLTFDIVDYTSGAIGLTANYYGNQNVFSSIGTHTAVFTSLNQTELRIYSENFIGSIDNVSVKEVTTATNTPRIDYSTGEKAFLLEPQSTNLITYSNDFSQSAWNKQSGVTATYNTTETLSPDGTYNATKLIGNGTTGIYDSVTASGVVSRSIYIKSVTGNVNVILKDPQNTVTRKTLNVTTQWQRFELVEDNTISSQGIWVDDIPSSGIYIWGAQVEEQSYATSYIPTDGATATRNQEVCVDATPVINSEEGTLYAEISALNSVTYPSSYITISDGTYNNRASILFSQGATNQIRTFLRVGGATQIDVSDNVSDVTDFNKIAFSYKLNDFKVYINGALVSSDTSGSVWSADTITKLSFSEISTNAGAFFGNTKGLKYYPKALADVQLEDLTTI